MEHVIPKKEEEKKTPMQTSVPVNLQMQSANLSIESFKYCEIQKRIYEWAQIIYKNLQWYSPKYVQRAH